MKIREGITRAQRSWKYTSKFAVFKSLWTILISCSHVIPNAASLAILIRSYSDNWALIPSYNGYHHKINKIK
jgi:hypothetical protein